MFCNSNALIVLLCFYGEFIQLSLYIKLVKDNVFNIERNYSMSLMLSHYRNIKLQKLAVIDPRILPLKASSHLILFSDCDEMSFQ